jgi:glycosyltransferase involved in cell wall biosynthesis
MVSEATTTNSVDPLIATQRNKESTRRKPHAGLLHVYLPNFWSVSDTAMKILIAHNRYQQAGGEDTVVAGEVRMLQERGHSVHQYVAENDGITDTWRQAVAAARSFYSRPASREISNLLAAFQPDILHVHNFFPSISPAIFFAARKYGVPVVQTLHNYRLLCANATLLRDGRPCEDCCVGNFFVPGVVHGCYRGSRTGSAVVGTSTFVHVALGTWSNRIDRYIALTQFAARKFGSVRIPAEKIRIKPNFAPDRGYGRGQGGFALYVGRLSSEKGIETILAADNSGYLPIPVHIVGDGPLRVDVERACARPGSRLVYLGQMSRSQVIQQMQNAVVLLVPSLWYEGFPMVIVEALSFGLPIIASRIGGLPEMVQDGQSGLLFEPGDPSALLQALRDFVSDTSRIKAMRHASRGHFDSYYTEQKNYETLIEIYRELLNDKPTPSAESLATLAHSSL